MTVALRLDAKALRVLLDEQPEFRLELQRAVIAEIVGKLYSNYVDNDIRNVVRTMFKGHEDDLTIAINNNADFRDRLAKLFSDRIASIKPSNLGRRDVRITPEFEAVLRSKAEAIAQELAEERGLTIANRVNEIADLAFSKLNADLEAKIERSVNIRVTEAVAVEVRSRVHAALSNALNDIEAADKA